MAKHEVDRQVKLEKQIRRNAARLKGCTIHEFDCRAALRRAKARRAALEEETGVSLGLRPIVWCRCKHCGGKLTLEYAIPYMDGVKAAYVAMDQLEQQGLRPP